MVTARKLAAGIVALSAVASIPATSGELDQGRAIYFGLSSSGVARIGNEATAPASRFGCFSCHGGDGLGGREGGFVAPTITRERLETADTVRPAYDLERFGRLLESGVDPSGRSIAPIMPRYELTSANVTALYDYLARVDSADRVGVGDTEITLGVLYDPGEAGAGQLVLRSLHAAMRALGDPKVFGRSIAIKSYASDDPRIGTDVFVAIMPLLNAERLARIGSDLRLPAISPVAGTRGDEDASLVRGVQAAARDQWKVLAGEVSAEAPLVYPPSMSESEASEMRRRLGLAANRQLLRLDLWLRDGKPATVLLLGGLSVSVPPGHVVDGTTVLSTLDGSAAGVEAWRQAGASIVLADARPVDRTRNTVPDIDRAADATLRVVLEMLARAGRDLTRTRLMVSFDGAAITLPDWPQLNYGEFRLTGTDEVSVLRLPAIKQSP